MTQLKALVIQGLWKSNPGLVQLLGLCPLLAVSSTITSAMGLGGATMLVLLCTNVAVSLVRNHIASEIRIPIFVLIIASVVTVVQLLMNAYTYDLYQALGIFIPLIVTNCIVIGRAEAFASKNPVLPSAIDGIMMGLGFSLVLILLGALREILGQGTLFDGADLLLGAWAHTLRIEIFTVDSHFLLAMLPPGAFLGMGLLIALKNVIDNRIKQKQTVAKGSITRARVTGAAQ